MNNSKQIHFEWIGAVPSNWELRKIKYIFMERKEMNNPIKSKNLISLTMDKGVIPHSEKEGGGNKPKEDLSKYKLVYPGDVVLNSMNVIAGAVGLSKYFGVVSPVYYMLKLLDKNSKAEYFNYLFRTEIFQKSLYGLGNGILIKENEDTGKLNTIRMRISMNKLGNQFIPVPPNKEQELIVEYLDLKTQKIDFLVKKIQEKIEFLEEQKLAFINQYVTKGLNQNIEMKDSEVDWIGLMPKEWETRKLKYIIESLNSGVSVNAEDIPIKSVNEFGVLKTSCVYSNIFNFNENKKVFKEEISRVKCPVKGNSIIISRMNTSNLVGSSGYVEKDFDNIFLPDRLWITEFKDVSSLSVKWLSYIMRSSPFKEVLSNLSTGTSASMKNLAQDDLLSVKIPFCKFEEQLKISSHLDNLMQKISLDINLHNKKLDLLKEYRQTLIYSIVTGKIRITEDMI